MTTIKSQFCRLFFASVLEVGYIILTSALWAQNAAGPQPAPLPSPIPAPVDQPYPGIISLSVDLTNVNDRVLNVRERVPAKPGETTLLYPQWLPGTHSPSNVVDLAGLVITANGNRVPWVRDRVDMWAFHLDVPKGASMLELTFQYLAPVKPQQGRISNKIADLTWNSVLLYPAGYFARRIQFSPELKLPNGWKFATALDVQSQNGDVVHFKQVALNTLVDSPLYAGINYKRVDLSNAADNPVYLDVFADKPEQLEMTADELQYHKNLAIQVQKLFQSRHYDHYDFLFSLSDELAARDWSITSRVKTAPAPTTLPTGLQESRVAPFCRTNTRIPGMANFAGQLTCGRRTSTCQCRDDLLWVYEGLTRLLWQCLDSPFRNADAGAGAG